MTPDDPPAPTIDDRYELLARIEDRGLGETWAARDTRFRSRVVALKFLPPLAAPGPSFDALVALRHAHVLATLGYGVSARGPYLVQDLFDGASLATLLAAGAPPARPLLARIFDAVCLAIAAAHGAPTPLAHGALGPASVLVRPLPGDGVEVQVTDFGFGPDACAPTDDVAALGALLRSLGADYEDVAAVVARATQPDPGQRFPSAEVLREAAARAFAAVASDTRRMPVERAVAAPPGVATMTATPRVTDDERTAPRAAFRAGEDSPAAGAGQSIDGAVAHLPHGSTPWDVDPGDDEQDAPVDSDER